MKLELVFISREGETRINEVRELLKNKISFISDGIFSYKNESYSYGLRKSKDNLNVFLSIMPVKETNTDEEAELLNSLKNDIIKGKHRGEYYIVVVYDGSSEYYCYELSKKIASVERKLRQLIYLTVLAVYGKDWVKNTINEEIKNKVAEVSRSKNNHEYIERALEYFTFQDYTDYLFEERMDKSYELLLEEIQFALYYEKEDRNKIQTIIAQGKKRSLWEKLFHPMDVENIKGDIEEIHHLRNIVMHNKAISLDKYVEADILLNKVGNSLDKASELAMEDKYSEEVFVADIISSMKKTFENWDSDRFVKAAKLIESLNLIENRLNNIVNSTNIISKLDFENKLNAISLNSSLAYIAKQNDWLSKIQKLVEPIGGLEVLENIDRQNHMFSKLKNHACPTLKNTALDMIEKQNNILSIGTSILPPFFCK